MRSIEIFTHYRQQLETIYPEKEADNICEWIFEHVTGLKKWQRKSDPDASPNTLTGEQINRLDEILGELLKHRPIQYVLEEAWFYKRKFFVNDAVLIPRPETEELVEQVIKYVKTGVTHLPCRILDIGTGSGCIPVSLKKEIPSCTISGIDVSLQALDVASANAKAHGADVQFLQLDFLNPANWPQLPQFDIIVSNPPYIPRNEKEKLDKHVRDFEPGEALFVDDENPFIFYEKILQFSKSHLKNPGAIFMEVHEKFGDQVRQLFDQPDLNVSLLKDIYGKDRILKVETI